LEGFEDLPMEVPSAGRFWCLLPETHGGKAWHPRQEMT
jgi:hypothetical protein